MMKLNPYSKYKDSGVEWLGEVPESWVMGPLKRGYQVKLGKMLQSDSSHSNDELLPYLRAANIQWGSVNTGDIKLMWLSPTERHQLRLLRGDLLVSEGGEVGRSAIWLNELIDCYFQNSINRVRGIAGNLTRFLYYWMVAIKANGYVDVLCNKATIAHFTAEKLAAVPTLFPTFKEQHAIAAFLDAETSRIDALMAEYETLIELLKEKRQALISHAVTKGLNPDVPLKASGVEWLGDVPEGWEPIPLHSMSSDSNSLFTDGDWIESKDLSDTGIRYITTGNVGEGFYKEQGAGFISEETFVDLGCTEVKPGDILISRLNIPIGRSCIIPEFFGYMVTSVDNVIFRPDRDFSRQFITYMLSSKAHLANMENLARGTTMQRISRSTLGSVKFCMPPPEEQHVIAAFLDAETSRMDALVQEAENGINLLRERRTTLISDAVTGKIDVRDWKETM